MYTCTLSGTAPKFVLYFDVQWSWLVVSNLAIVLELLSVIYQSHHHNIPVWKLSPNAAAQILGLQVAASGESSKLDGIIEMPQLYMSRWSKWVGNRSLKSFAMRQVL